MARGTPRPSPAVIDVPTAIQQGAVGYILSQLGNPFIPAGAGLQNIYGAMPLMASDDVAALIDIARQQSAAAAAFGSPDVYRRPSLAEIPVCPGCPAGKVETTIRVELSDPTLVDARGNPVTITHGVVHCVGNRIPTAQDIADCADSWAESIMERSYSQHGGFQLSYEVTSAQRGTFFGR